MKKVFIVSLLLISIFLIGSTEMAFAQWTLYCCDGMVREDGEVQYTTSDSCMGLYDDGSFEVGIDMLGSVIDTYGGTLYPAPDSKHLLGTIEGIAFGWGGCSVEFKGVQALVKITWVQDDNGWVTTYTCTPSNNCCVAP